MKPVILIIGAGAGIGGNVAKRFASDGYHAVLCRRTDEEGLARLVGAIKEAGGTATGMILDASKEGTIEQTVQQVEKEIGVIEVVLFNLGAQIGNRALADTSVKQFEMGWRIATLSLFRLAHAVIPLMQARGHGTILVTSATAAMRGNAGQHSHAPAMGARRMLCQSLNAEFAPKGIHISHVLVDGSVDAPDTLGKLLGPELFQKLREERGLGHDGLLLPAEMAETFYHLAHQHRSAWTHESDLRPFSEKPWWNS